MNRQYAALSGIAIVLIVLNHTIHFGLQVSPVEGGWLNGLILLQALGAFAVPAFLFISGAFLSYAGGALSLGFIRNNLSRILWPYLIWSAGFYTLVFLIYDERYSASGYVANLLVGYPYHFVPLLVFWYLTAPVLVRLARRHGWMLLAATGAFQVFLLSLRFPFLYGGPDGVPWWLDALRPPVLFNSMSDWAIYFPLGLVLGLRSAAIKPYLLRYRWLALTAACAAFALGILNAFELLWAPWARFAAPVPVMFLLPVMNRGSIPLVRQFEMLGKRSYGIYLAHFTVINFIVFLLGNLDVGFPAMTYLALLVGAIGVTLLLMEGMTIPSPTRRIHRYVFG